MRCCSRGSLLGSCSLSELGPRAAEASITGPSPFLTALILRQRRRPQMKQGDTSCNLVPNGQLCHRPFTCPCIRALWSLTSLICCLLNGSGCLGQNQRATAAIATANMASRALQCTLQAAALDQGVAGFALAISGLVQHLIFKREFKSLVVFCVETECGFCFNPCLEAIIPREVLLTIVDCSVNLQK